jgi:hypothetical protein
MYILVRIEDLGAGVTAEPCEVYEDLEDALHWVGELEALNEDPQNVIFDLIEFEEDEEPLILGDMRERRQKLLDLEGKTLEKLIKKGMVEQLVDEEGRFCYEITSKAKETMKGLPYQVVENFLKDIEKRSRN